MNEALRVAVIGSTGFIGRHVSAAVRSCVPRSTLFGVSRTDDQPVPLDRRLVMTLGDDQPALERFLAEERPDVGPGMSAATLPGKIAAFIRESEGTDLEVGSLDSYRHFIDVRDAARAMVQAAVRPARVCGEIVNIGSGCARLTRELAEEMVTRSPRSVRLHESRTGSARSGGVDWQEADVEKANRLLEWEPCYPWETTLEYLTGAGAR